MEDPSDRFFRISRILKGEEDISKTKNQKNDFSGIESIESAIETKKSSLDEISMILDIDRRILNQIINISLMISIFTLITVAFWLYSSFSNLPYQILFFSAIALALINIVIALKIKRLVSTR